LELDVFLVDHLQRGLHDYGLVHLDVMKNHRELVNLRDVVLNLVLMAVKMDVRKMDVRNFLDDQSLVYLNYCDALPCSHSLITIEI
jgi:hypothetical protein